MKRSGIFGLGVLAALAATSAAAQTDSATGLVQLVRTYGDGRVLVTGFNFPNATCNNGSFWIPGDHPNLARLLSTVLAARAMGATLTVVAKTDSCWYPQITTDETTTIIINND